MPRLTLIKRRLVGYRCAGQVFHGLDLRSMVAPGSEWTNCTFAECKMNLASFRGAKFIGCNFRECGLDLADFSGSSIFQTSFTGCSLEQASFAQSDLTRVAFGDCRLTYATFQGGTCRETVHFLECNLHGGDIDFLECDAGSPEFDGCNLWNVRMAMGCSTWNGQLDRTTARRFAAMLNRMHPDPNLQAFAGDQMATVERLMGGKDGE